MPTACAGVIFLACKTAASAREMLSTRIGSRVISAEKWSDVAPNAFCPALATNSSCVASLPSYYIVIIINVLPEAAIEPHS